MSSVSQPVPDTRTRLLQAAGEVFAEHGFHAATVRQITERAGVNLAAVNYHFRDKAELYAAVIRDCFFRSGNQPPLDPTLPCEERLRLFIERFVHERFDPFRPEWHHRLMVRETMEPTPALQTMIDEQICPRARELAGIIQEITGPGLTEEEVRLLTFSVIGQAVFYIRHNTLAGRIFPACAAEPPDASVLAAHIHRFSLAALRHYRDSSESRST